MVERKCDVSRVLTALKSKLDVQSTLDVIHEHGLCWKAHFTFNASATEEELEAVRKELGLPLSPTYEEFLLLSDGARLYYDDQYGQWGFTVYGTKELVGANKRWRDVYKESWQSTHVVFAESFGDADILVFDTVQSKDVQANYQVIDGDSGYRPKEWDVIAPSFGDWLDRLVVAQGAKYWRWY